MAKSLGIHLTRRIASGMIEEQTPCSSVLLFPENQEDPDLLLDMPLDGLIDVICQQAKRVVAEYGAVHAVGLALPGIIRDGVVDDSPNLVQLKGARIAERMRRSLGKSDINAPVTVLNDADAIAAGVAAKHDRLHNFVRIWALGYGIGFGRYPFSEGIWEGGHTVVTLEPGETFCGCGGRGHLEGIMGYRSMRLRFLDMEPEEVFASARAGDKRCAEFVRLWHRSLAAATSNSIHLEGPGRFYFTGTSIHFLDLKLLQHYLQQMVKMSPLQSYTLESIPMSEDLAVTGAAITAAQQAGL